MTYKVIYLRHYEKIIQSRFHLSCKHSLIGISQCNGPSRSNKYFDKAIQCVKAAGLSLSARSFKGWEGTAYSGIQIGFYCKTSSKSYFTAKGLRQRFGYSNKRTTGKYLEFIFQNKEKGWVKEHCQRKFYFNMILTVCPQRNSSTFINFLSLIICQTRIDNIQINYLFRNKNNYHYANCSYLCPCFI